MDLFYSMMPLYRLSRVFGMAPFVVVTNEDKTRAVRVTTSSVLYSVFVILTLCCMNCLEKYTKHNTRVIPKYNELAYIIMLVLSTYSNAVNVVAVFVNIKNRERTADFLNSLNKIDLLMTGMKVDHESERKNTSSVIKAFVSLWLLVMPAGFVFRWIKTDVNERNLIGDLVTVSGDALYVIHHVSVIQYVLTLGCLKRRFQRMNDEMREELGKQIEDEVNNTATVEMMGQYGKGVRVAKRRLDLRLVRRVTRLHGMAYDTTEDLNRIYGTHLGMFIFGVFCTTVGRAYMSVVRINSDMVFDKNYTFLITSTVWMLLNNIALHVLSFKTTSLTKEAQETGILLHKISATVYDGKTLKMLRIHSLILLRQKVQFSINGLFPLNRATFFDIFASIATYITIIAQFELALASLRVSLN